MSDSKWELERELEGEPVEGAAGAGAGDGMTMGMQLCEKINT